MSALAITAVAATFLLCLAVPERLAAARVRALRDGASGAAPGPPRRPTGGSAGAVPVGPAARTRPGHGVPIRARHTARRARELQAATVLVADLLAACLAAGASPTEAADAVAGAVAGPAGADLRRAVGLIRLGADPGETWRELGATIPQADGLRRLGRALARAAESGTGAAVAMAAEAELARGERRAGAEAALARVGVYAAAPLGLCFLPAFVCLGVIPMIVDLAETVLGSH